MQRQQIQMAALAFTLGFGVLYMGSEFLPLPLPWYFPLERQWQWTSQPGAGLKMGWYGKVLISCFGGAGLSALTLWAQVLRPKAELRHFLELSTLGIFLFTLYYIARSLSFPML